MIDQVWSAYSAYWQSKNYTVFNCVHCTGSVLQLIQAEEPSPYKYRSAFKNCYKLLNVSIAQVRPRCAHSAAQESSVGRGCSHPKYPCQAGTMASLISRSSGCSEHRYCWSSHEKPARNVPGMCWHCHVCSTPLPGTRAIALTWNVTNQSGQFGPTSSYHSIHRTTAPRWLNNAEMLHLDAKRVCSGVLGGLRAVNI